MVTLGNLWTQMKLLRKQISEPLTELKPMTFQTPVGHLKGHYHEHNFEKSKHKRPIFINQNLKLINVLKYKDNSYLATGHAALL